MGAIENHRARANPAKVINADLAGTVSEGLALHVMPRRDYEAVVADVNVVANHETTSTVKMAVAVDVGVVTYRNMVPALDLCVHKDARTLADLHAGNAIECPAQPPAWYVRDKVVDQNLA